MARGMLHAAEQHRWAGGANADLSDLGVADVRDVAEAALTDRSDILLRPVAHERRLERVAAPCAGRHADRSLRRSAGSVNGEAVAPSRPCMKGLIMEVGRSIAYVAL